MPGSGARDAERARRAIPGAGVGRLSRRRFLAGMLGSTALAACGRREASWPPDRRPQRSRVAVLRADRYDDDLADLVLRGLRTFGVAVGGRRVVLKPNYVEFDPGGVINTHPAVVGAVAEAFARLGAAEVVVAEGPGHRRDNEYLLDASGLEAVLRDRRLRYVDLNFDSVESRPLPTRFTQLGRLWLPRTVLDADLLVSLPKLKTHHWAGVTLSMKNLFGIVPGAIYGWPKNVLHWAGLQESIVDLNAVVDVPRLAIVDAVVGMEGNGPIQGTPRALGALVMGRDFAAVDATCARLMGLDPGRVDHLRWAGSFLGNVDPERIDQVGDDPRPLRRDFEVLPRFAHLRA